MIGCIGRLPRLNCLFFTVNTGILCIYYMASDWSGFTDEELRLLKEKTRQTNQDRRDRRQENLKRATDDSDVANSCRKQRPREKIRAQLKSCGIRTSTCVQDRPSEICHEDKGQFQCGEWSVEKRFTHIKKEKIATETKTKPDAEDSRSMTPIIRGENREPEIEVIDEPERIQAIELSALQKMQSKQKQMEEENKKKKALLQQTIAERSSKKLPLFQDEIIPCVYEICIREQHKLDRLKKTQKETRTLAVVREELKRLDCLLSADVSLLRDKIEVASFEYHQAQKRYERAEAEFVAAKFDLHKKTECKEQLTEHLCVIIEENEVRKAKKLEELMTKLELREDSILGPVVIVPDIVPENTNRTVAYGTETTCTARGNKRETKNQT